MSNRSQAYIQKPAPDFAGTAVVNGDFKKIKLSDYRGIYRWMLLLVCADCSRVVHIKIVFQESTWSSSSTLWTCKCLLKIFEDQCLSAYSAWLIKLPQAATTISSHIIASYGPVCPRPVWLVQSFPLSTNGALEKNVQLLRLLWPRW